LKLSLHFNEVILCLFIVLNLIVIFPTITILNALIAQAVVHWFAEIYAKGCTLRELFGISNYSLGQKYCRRCEVYVYNDGVFCPR